LCAETPWDVARAQTSSALTRMSDIVLGCSGCGFRGPPFRSAFRRGGVAPSRHR
jgi:hypothetical protein